MTTHRRTVAAAAVLAVGAVWVSGCAASSSPSPATAVAAPSATTASDTVLQLRGGDHPAGLAGLWTSTDDPGESVTFDSDGTTSRDYTGQPPRSGTWAIVGPEHVPGLPATTAADATILEITDDVDGLPLQYVVLSLTEQELTLSYLPRGNTLHYVR